jgi:uncharacterized membrane protein
VTAEAALREGWARRLARWALALGFGAAGVLHLTSPEPFLAITPDWVPAPEQVIRWTGVAELAGAAGVLTRRFRKAAGVGLALYAVCVFPANVKHALEGVAIGGTTLGWGYHGPRLLLQPVIVWWALWASGVVEWPFRRRA